MKGWVYIISNQAMPDVVKVGFSTKDPDLRASELNHTELRILTLLITKSWLSSRGWWSSKFTENFLNTVRGGSGYVARSGTADFGYIRTTIATGVSGTVSLGLYHCRSGGFSVCLGRVCSETFMEAYFRERTYDLSPEGRTVLNLSADLFFRLGPVLDWVQEHRDDIRRNAVEIDHMFCSLLKQLRDDYDKNPSTLDREASSLPFDHRRPATFVLIQLLRMLVLEAKAFQFKKNDGLDVCHAVLASAYGSLITLDKQWKRRVENLPWQDHRPSVYYRPQVDELVDELEAVTASR